MWKYSETTSALAGILQQSCDDDFKSDYWNIDDIIGEEEMVPCVMRKDANNVAYLSQLSNLAATSNQKKVAKEKSKNQVLSEGTQLELPLWLAIALHRRTIVNLKKPVTMTDTFLN